MSWEPGDLPVKDTGDLRGKEMVGMRSASGFFNPSWVRCFIMRDG